MPGHEARDFKPLTAVSLDDLVPEDNFYRQVERSLDLSFVHDLANDFYSNIGRPSIDPVVFFKTIPDFFNRLLLNGAAARQPSVPRERDLTDSL